MSKAWGGAGAWALETERAEAEERERAANPGDDVAEAPANSLLAGQPDQSFPSLHEAAATKSKKKNKPVSLAQFQSSSAVPAPGPFSGRRESAFESKGLTPAEILRLPTGPRERSQEELEHGRLGGGFRSYGGGFPNRRSDDADGSWGAGGGRRGYGGFEDEQRSSHASRGSDIDQPSRADEADNWGAGKKPMITDSGGRQDRYGSFGTDSTSRADEVDDWASSKKSLPTRYSNFGSGDSRAHSDSDRWMRGREESVPTNGERRKLVLDPPKRDIVASSEPVKNRPSPFGAARPREDILSEKGVDWRKIDSENDVKKTSRPTSSHSSRPSTAQSSRPGSPGTQTTLSVEPAEVAPKPRPKVNPFGDAKPREVVLQEKGKDWKKLDKDMEHYNISRPETEKEIELKDDINVLKELAKEAEGDDLNRIKENLAIIESELELLTRKLDDKVKFGHKAINNVRPGSASSGADASSARSASQSGMIEEHRNNEYVERPRSLGGPAGSADFWSKSMDDRRGGSQGGRERGFFESRNMDRSKSREGW